MFPRRSSLTIDVNDEHEIVDALTCMVCLEFMTEPCVLNCGHTICLSCWHDWKDNERHITCPMCRAVDPSELRKQSALMKMLATSLARRQPRYESRRHECSPKIQDHIVHHLLRTKKQWEREQVSKLQEREGREWETNERDSIYRQFASLRVRNAIEVMSSDCSHVPRYIIDWSHENQHVFGKMQVPLKIRTWLDAVEQRYF